MCFAELFDDIDFHFSNVNLSNCMDYLKFEYTYF